MVTTPRYEDPINDHQNQTSDIYSETHKITSYDRHPDFPITYLTPTLNGKLHNKVLKSYSQIKAKPAVKDQQLSRDSLGRTREDQSKAVQYSKYLDYTPYSHYIASKKSTSLIPASLTSHITDYKTATTSTTAQPTTYDWSRLVSVQTYPRTQTLLVGYDAVLQCRDEGRLRKEVFWQREGGRQLPPHSSQERGRLEILGVTLADEGDYECVAVGHEHEDGGTQISSVWIQKY